MLIWDYAPNSYSREAVSSSDFTSESCQRQAEADYPCVAMRVVWTDIRNREAMPQVFFSVEPIL